MDDRLGEAHAHAVALGERVDVLRGHFVQAAEVERLAHAFGRIGQAAEVGGEAEELADGHLAVGRRAFGRVAQMLLGLDGLVGDVEARDRRGAFVGAEVAGEHLHRGGLPGAVGPEEGDDLAAVDGEGDVAYGADGAVGLGEVLGFDEGHGEKVQRFCGVPMTARRMSAFWSRSEIWMMSLWLNSSCLAGEAG